MRSWRVGDPAPSPLPRRSEAEVVARWRDGPPLVSILCPAYQHVGFIEDALRGFLGQDTDFPFEVIVRDDASTDGTAEIVRDYADRYPSIVRAILEPSNTRHSVKAFTALQERARGRLIAPCEGDDYWFRADHLTVRAEALIADSDASAVVGGQVIVRDGVIADVDPPPAEESWLWAVPLRTILFRASVRTKGILAVNGDTEIALAAQREGRLAGIGSCSAVYRIHSGGVWTSQSRERRKISIVEQLLLLAEQLAIEGDLPLANRYHARAVEKAGAALAALGVGVAGVRGRRVGAASGPSSWSHRIAGWARRLA